MIYLVTGVSRGLGEAIAKALLDRRDTVIGIGRSHHIEHPSFSFRKCDLSNAIEVTKLNFDELKGPVTLINNAGILGDVGRLSQLNDITNLEKVLQVNTIAPFVLARHLYDKVDKDLFTLVNISSGAALRAIPSWGAYCASKAALNMLTEAFYLEERELGRQVKVYAVAPGVVDTGMQEQIRSTNVKDFSSVKRFVDLKKNNELYSPQEAAERLLLLLKAEFTGEVVRDLREIG